MSNNYNNSDEETILDQGADTKGKDTAAEPKAQKDNGWKKVIIGSSVGYVLGTATSILTASALLHGEEKVPDDVQTEGYASLFDDDISIASSVNDKMSFSEAFDAAREEVGPGGVFLWHGNLYNTYTPDEWDNMSDEEHAEYEGHFTWLTGQPDDSAEDLLGEDDVLVEEEVVPVEEEDVVVEEEVIPVEEEVVPVQDAAPVQEEAPQVVYTSQPAPVHDYGVSVATGVSDDMSFSQAFAEAREEVGPGGVFEWHGNLYNTFYAEEWNHMSAGERAEFASQVAGVSVHDDSVNQYAQNTDGYNYSDAPQVVETVNDSDTVSDVEVVSLVYDYETGMNVGDVVIEGHEFVFVDVNDDGTFNLVGTDLNNDGELSVDDGEVIDISGDGITVGTLLAYSDVADDMLLASNDDYVNDADVSDYLA